MRRLFAETNILYKNTIFGHGRGIDEVFWQLILISQK